VARSLGDGNWGWGAPLLAVFSQGAGACVTQAVVLIRIISDVTIVHTHTLDPPAPCKKRKERGTRQESFRVRFWRAGRLAICIWRLRSDLSGSIVNANPAQISLDAIFA